MTVIMSRFIMGFVTLQQS